MEKRPFFSVIVPFHNAEKYLEHAVCSILGQTFSDFEVIVVDDASTDRSREEALKLAASDDRVHVVFLEKNVGAGEARNVGIRRARGEYIMFLDADDAFSGELLAKVRQSLEEHPAQVVLWGLVEEYRDASQTLVQEVTVTYPAMICGTREEVRAQIMDLEEKSLYGYLWNKAYQTDYLKSLGILIPTQAFNEDEMFNIGFFMEVSEMNVLDYVGTHYSKRVEGSLTNRYLPDYYPIAMGRVRGLLDQQIHWGTDTAEVREKLAGIWVRYLASALERNCDRRRSMGIKEKREFVGHVMESWLYRELLPFAKPQHPAFKLLVAGLKSGNKEQCLAVGKMIHTAKSAMPGKFRKARAKK